MTTVMTPRVGVSSMTTTTKKTNKMQLAQQQRGSMRVVVARAERVNDVVVAAEKKEEKRDTNAAVMMTPALLATCYAGAAQAAVDPVASAFAAYGHYLGLVLVVGALTTERLTVKANMSE